MSIAETENATEIVANVMTDIDRIIDELKEERTRLIAQKAALDLLRYILNEKE